MMLRRRTGTQLVLTGWIVLACLVSANNGLVCYICSNSTPKDISSCIETPTGQTYNCSSERVCTLNVQYNKKTHDIISVGRNCLVPGTSGCMDDWTNTNCQLYCSHNLCNNVSAVFPSVDKTLKNSVTRTGIDLTLLFVYFFLWTLPYLVLFFT